MYCGSPILPAESNLTLTTCLVTGFDCMYLQSDLYIAIVPKSTGSARSMLIGRLGMLIPRMLIWRFDCRPHGPGQMWYCAGLSICPSTYLSQNENPSRWHIRLCTMYVTSPPATPSFHTERLEARKRYTVEIGEYDTIVYGE